MKLFLHAGLNKAGSTSIQSVIHRNYNALKRQGILIPKTGTRPTKNRRHFQFMSSEGEDYKNLVDQLITEAKESNCHTVILSDESICKKSPLKHDYLKSFFDEIKVIFFLRRQDLFLESHYNQMIKSPWLKKRSYAEVNKLTEFGMSLEWLHFDRLLNSFAAIFGKESIVAFPFERNVIPENIGEFFLLDVCGFEDSGLDLNQTIANTSVPYSSLGILRSLNKKDMSILSNGGKPRQIIERIIRRELSDTSKYIIDHDSRKEFMKNYEEGNSYVARKYLKLDSGQLFKARLPAIDEPIQETCVSDADTIEIMGKIIIALAKQMRNTSA